MIMALGGKVRGKIQREHFNYFCDLMGQIEWDLHQEVLDAKRIPREWHEIAKGKGTAEKIRLTLRVDGDVVRFFRKMGKGYQQRMNDVLAAWMHGRLAALIEGPDTADIVFQSEELGRPWLGQGDLMDRGFLRRADGRFYDLEKREIVGDVED